MTALRRAADRVLRTGPPPVPSSERLFAVERAAARLEGRRRDTGERTAAMRALRQRLAALPGDPGPLLAEALAAERRSLDRAIIHAYRAALSVGHPALEALRAAAETAARRHDWHWRDHLYEPESRDG
jgi:hypothetical protein